MDGPLPAPMAEPLPNLLNTGCHPAAAALLGLAVVPAAVLLDRLVGDPRWCLHPVVVMGWWITRLRRLAEAWAGDRPWRLRLAGGLITVLLVTGSAGAVWGLERLALGSLAEGLGAGASAAAVAAALAATLLLLVALASALAGRSLEQAVLAVLQLLPPAGQPSGVEPARQALSWIVGRDTAGLDRAGILRAAAETASENAVDGLFAPLFWMLVGAWLWVAGTGTAPGPLALAWGFKAASTLDSMLGYRRGRLAWLGTAGARLDDLLVWLPCRLVAASLTLVSARPWRAWAVLQDALRDGRPDPSPNAGVSQAAYAHSLGVQLGGVNVYGGEQRRKPLLAAGGRPADGAVVLAILALNRRLCGLWLALASLGGLALSARSGAGHLELPMFITKTLS